MSRSPEFTRNRKSVPGSNCSDYGSIQSSVMTPALIGAALPTWPEWSDADINAECWEAATMMTTTNKARGGGRQITPISSNTPPYEDCHTVPLLPPSVAPVDWKRPAELFPNEKLTLYSEEEFDITSPNVHLLHSGIMVSIIAAISSLSYLGFADQFLVEEESMSFSSNMAHVPWKPWHHIYSLCKAGRGQTHKPLYNALGKYYVRLFYMGCWRKITVDDRIPVDENNEILLPCSSLKHELWPIILSKAILKLASLTWNQKEEVVDFSVVSCLTGWMRVVVDTAHWSVEQVWEVCTKHVSAYQYPDEAENKEWELENHEQVGPEVWEDVQPVTGLDTARESDHNLRPKFQRPGQNTREKNKDTSVLPMKPARPVVLFGVVDDVGTHPSWDHEFLIQQTRDTYLLKTTKPPRAQTWKRFRWQDWATKTGIPQPEEHVYPLRYLKIVSYFKKQTQRIVGVEEPCGGSEHKISLSQEQDTSSSKTLISKMHTGHRKKRSSFIIPASFKTHKQILPQNSLQHTIQHRSRNIVSRSSIEIMDRDTGKEHVPITGMASLLFKRHSLAKKSEISLVPQTEEIPMWINLRTTVPYIKRLFIFYKPSYFNYNVRVSDFTFNPALRTHNRLEKKSSRDVIGNIYFRYPNILNKTRNDTLYFYLDSCESKELLVTLSVLSNKAPLTHLPDENIEIPCDTVNMATVLVELFDWRDVRVRKPIIAIKTFGYTTKSLYFDEGRYVLRFWINTKANYVLQCLSTCNLFVGQSGKVRDYMTQESDRMLKFVNEISMKFSNVYHMFGKPEYLNAIRDFYRVLYDVSRGNKDRSAAYSLFLNALMAIVKETFSADDQNLTMTALRTVFRDPTLGRALSVAGPIPEERKDKEHMSALIIQAVFKKFMLKEFKDQGTGTRKVLRQIIDKIRRVNEVVFQVPKKDVIPKIMRRMAMDNPDAVLRFPLCSDFQLTVNIEECKGVADNIHTHSWMPVMRIILTCHGDDVMTAVKLYCGLSAYVVRVINNDTFEEIPRLTVDPDPCRFYQNKRGYTVFAYGWSENMRYKEIAWRLHVITPKYSPGVHACFKPKGSQVCIKVKPPTLSTEELRNFYIPNKHNLICRCLIKLKHRGAVLSFRFYLSYAEAVFSLTVLDNNGSKIVQVEGEGSVILPAVFLEPYAAGLKHSPKDVSSKDNVYVLEAHVLKDSWPLTKAEWENVSMLKRRGTAGAGMRRDVLPRTFSSPSFARQSPRKAHPGSGQEQSWRHSDEKRRSCELIPGLERPCWVLQAVVDAHADAATVSQDRRREEKMKLLKKTWEQGDPGRATRGSELRKTFFRSHSIAEQAVVGDLGLLHRRSWSLPTLEDDERFHSPPEGSSKQHRSPGVEDFMDKPPDGRSIEATQRNFDMETGRRKELQLEFESKYQQMKEVGEAIMKEQKQRHKCLVSYFHEKIKQSKQVVLSSYKMRDDFVSQMILEEKLKKERLAQREQKSKKKSPVKNKNPKPHKTERTAKL